MSLINQMLRDLEQRKPNQPEPGQPLSIQLPQPAKTGTYTKYLGIGLIALAFYFIYQTTQQPNTPQSPAISVSSLQPDTAETEMDNNIQISPDPTEVSAISDAEIAPVQQAINMADSTQDLTNANHIQIPVSAAEVITQPDTRLTPNVNIAKTSPALTATNNIKPDKPVKSPSFRTSAKKVKNQSPRIKKSPESNTQALYRQAQNSASLMMRKEILKDLLIIDPQDLSARNLLLQTLLKSNSPAELDIFLQESLHLFPNHLAFITTQAHSQIQRKQIAAAIATLERVDSSQINEPTYLSLLAAAYQQQQQYQKAAAIYQKLTYIQPNKAEHWLGQGICAENLHHNQTASMAYQQALNKNTLNSPVVDYIKQRLTSLN